jgi:hypothetical protein
VQFVLPFLVDAGDQNERAGEAPRPQTYSASEARATNQLTQQISPTLDTHGRKKRNASPKPPSASIVAPEAKLLVSRKVAAEMLSISVRGVDYLIAAGRLSTRRIANRVLVPIEEIRRFAQSDHPQRMVG